jgi:hypothetical protein
MITLLASLTGFLSSAFPYFIKMMQDKNDKNHELAIMDRQIEMQKFKLDGKLEEIELVRQQSLDNVLYQTYHTNISWVDALNGTVRPLLAYSFFLLYGFIKCKQYNILSEEMPSIVALEMMWSLEDQAIFASIISFYYGQRTIAKIKRG